jgi:hypothetical protein
LLGPSPWSALLSPRLLHTAGDKPALLGAAADLGHKTYSSFGLEALASGLSMTIPGSPNPLISSSSLSENKFILRRKISVEKIETFSHHCLALLLDTIISALGDTCVTPVLSREEVFFLIEQGYDFSFQDRD